MESFRFTASTSFRGGGNGIEPITPKYRKQYDPFAQGYFNPVDAAFGEQPVIPFTSPWSFSLNFGYSWRYRHNNDPLETATLNAQSISFNLTLNGVLEPLLVMISYKKSLNFPSFHCTAT